MFSLRCKYNVHGLCSLQDLQHVQLYSTSINGVNQIANYLVNHLGFSQQQSLSTSTKLQTQKVNYSKLPGNCNSVVNFLKQNDFDDTHLRKIVSLYPRILFSNVDKTLKPKFKLLQDLGITGSNLITIISSNPTFGAKQINHVIPNLRTILGSEENLIKYFRKLVYCTTSTGLENLVLNISLLKNDYGVDIEVIRKFICQQSRSYMRNTEILKNVGVRVEEGLRIPRDSKMFMYGIQLLSSLSEKNIESKRQMFKSFGWTEYHVSELIRKNPSTFMPSEENIRNKLGFLMNELGYKPDFLASHSALFTCSLEKRMKPRHRVLLILKEKDLLDYNFFTAINKTETQFLRIVVKPFEDAVPGLLEIYQNSKGCPNVAPK